MSSLLTGLGSVAGGVSQGLSPYLQALMQQMQQQMQQKQQNTATGQGLGAAYNLPPLGQQQSQGGLGSLMGNLFGGGQAQAPQTAPTPAPPQQTPFSPVSPPSSMVAPIATAQSPMPVPQATPAPMPQAPQQQAQGPSPAPQMQAAAQTPLTALQAAPQAAPSPQPRGTPGTPSPGVAPPPPIAAPQTQAAPSAPSQSNQPQPQGQTQSPYDAVHQQYQGMFDLNQMARNLWKQPGMTYEKVGRIMNAPGFERMLNQQGLMQFKAAGLGIQQQRADTAERAFGARRGEDGEGRSPVEGAEGSRVTDFRPDQAAGNSKDHL